MFLRTVSIALLAFFGIYSLGNSSSGKISDIRTIYGGGDCSEKKPHDDSTDCGEFSTTCIRCNSTSVNTYCADFHSAYHCIACEYDGDHDCGGDVLIGTKDSKGVCILPQVNGVCSRMYYNQNVVDCTNGPAAACP